MSPTWGYGPMGNPYKELDYAHRLSELGVSCIEAMITANIEEWKDIYYQGKLYIIRSHSILNYIYTLTDAYKLKSADRKNMMRYIMARFPDITSIYIELDRKYKLIRKQLE